MYFHLIRVFSCGCRHRAAGMSIRLRSSRASVDSIIDLCVCVFLLLRLCVCVCVWSPCPGKDNKNASELAS